MERRTFNVLLIEDDEDDFILVKSMLSGSASSKFRLKWVDNYDEGLKAICLPDYDVVLLDYRLGARNGLDLLYESAEKECRAPVILLTGRGGYEVDLEAMRAGASDYLVKGQIGAELLDRSIRYAFERKRSELELRRYHDHLEDLVDERTTELAEKTRQLEAANEELRLEIAERRRAEEALKNQKEFLTTIIESLAHPFYVLDAKDYTIRMANSAALPKGPAPGTSCHVLTHGGKGPCAGAHHKCPLEEIKRTGRPVTTEHVHYDEKGNLKYIEVHGYPIFDSQGRVEQIIEYTLDITERKEMEEALRRARDELELRVFERTSELARANEALRLDESRLETLVELSQMTEASVRQISDFVLEQQVRLTVSKFGWLAFLNEDETILTPYTCSKAGRKKCTIIDKPARVPVDEAGIWADAIGERKIIVINECTGLGTCMMQHYPEADTPIERLLIIPVLEANRVVAIAAVANKDEAYDSSDVRQLSLLMDGMWRLIQRERAQKALRESESLAAMGRALSGVAHDMKTPLIAIGGFTGIVHKHLEKTDPDREKLEIVLKEARRLEGMVKDMLDFSRPLELERSSEDINRMIAESLAVIESAAREKRVAIQTELDATLPRFSFDAMRMKQVLINLVLNAIQASPEEGIVRISTHFRRQSLIVDIEDCGCGIPVERREEVFLPFVSTKKEGTGLGLPIVRKIVEAHNGRVQILDNPREGVTFRLSLPL